MGTRWKDHGMISVMRWALPASLLMLFNLIATVTANKESVAIHPDPELESFYGGEELEVTFSRPMVPLGTIASDKVPMTLLPEVKGSWTWVDTAVCVFRPEEFWQAETDYTVKLKDDLKDAFNQVFKPEGKTEWTFQVDDERYGMRPYMYLHKVWSNLADEVTGGAWHPNEFQWHPWWRRDDEGGAEVPQDGRIIILLYNFGPEREVPINALKNSFIMRKVDDGNPVDIVTEVCRKTDVEKRERRWLLDNCLAVTPQARLATDTAYDLVLPKGLVVSGETGSIRLSQDLSVRVRGPYPFTFPFDNNYWGDGPGPIPLDDVMETSGGGRRLQRFGQTVVHKFQRQRLGLRHGLAADVTMTSLKEQFELNPAVEKLELIRIDKATVELRGDFQPGQEYELKVKASDSIKDGFGLPLQASSCKFKMADLKPVFRSPEFDPQSGVLFLRSDKPENDGMWDGDILQWPLLFRGEGLCRYQNEENCEEQYEDSAGIPFYRVKEAIVSLMSGSRTLLNSERTIKAPWNKAASFQTFYTRQTHLHTRWGSPHMKPLRTRWGGTRGTEAFVKASFVVGVSNLIVDFHTWEDRTVCVWVFRQEQGKIVPVQHMQVQMFRSYVDSLGNDMVDDPISRNTDLAGQAQFTYQDASTRSNDEIWWAVIYDTQGSSFRAPPLLLPVPAAASFYRPYRPRPERRFPWWAAKLITDRAAYSPGETIHVKGYIRDTNSEDETTEEMCDNVPNGLVLDVTGWKEITVEVDKKFCSFEAKIQVPPTTTFGEQTMTLRRGYRVEGSGWIYFGAGGNQVDFWVMDSRKPSVNFFLDCCDSGVMSPDDLEVPIVGGVALVSNERRSPENGTVVTVVWELDRPCLEFEDYDPHGRRYYRWDRNYFDLGLKLDGQEMCETFDDSKPQDVELITDEKGEFHHVWKARDHFKDKLMAGDVLIFNFFFYHEPTRDFFREKRVILVDYSEDTIQLSMPCIEVIPGIPFSVDILTKQLEKMGGAVLPDKRLKVTVHEAGTMKGALNNVPRDKLPLGQQVMECKELVTTDRAGKATSCALQVQEIGHYLVTACVSEGSKCSAIKVGKNSTEWNAAPLRRFLPNAVKIVADKAEYGPDESVKLSFYNPRPNSMLVVAWGSPVKTRIFKDLPKGDREEVLHDITSAGEGCDQGCLMVATLTSPASNLSTVPVPASHLFDPQMPEYTTTKLNITVHAAGKAPPRPLRLRLDPRGDAQPGKQAILKVHLQDEAGNPTDGEVCIFATDSAMLALRRHDVADLTTLRRRTLFELDNPDEKLPEVSAHSSLDALVSNEVLKNATSWMEKVVDLDPFLLDYVRWPLHPDQEKEPEQFYGPWWWHRDPVHVTDVETSIEQVKNTFYGVLTGYNGGPQAPFYPPYHEIDWEDQREDPVGSRRRYNKRPRPEPYERYAPWNEEPEEQDRQLSHRLPALMPGYAATPLFKTVQVTNGEAEVTWDVPMLSGTGIELRAYAVGSKPGSLGSDRKIQRVARQVTCTSTLPRVLRVGDKVEAGLTLALRGGSASTQTYKVSIQLPQGLEIVAEEAEVEVSLGGSGAKTKDANFKLAVNGGPLGEHKLTMKVTSGSSEVDTIVLPIIVQGHQTTKLLTSAVVVQSCSNDTLDFYNKNALGKERPPCVWGESILIPRGHEVKNKLHLQMGAGYWPVAATTFNEFEHLVTGHHGQAIAHHHPSVVELLGAWASFALSHPAKNIDDDGSLLDKISRVTEALSRMTNSRAEFGLHYTNWTEDDRYGWWYQRNQIPDLHLNAVALYMVRRMKAGIKGFNAKMATPDIDWSNRLYQLKSSIMDWETATKKALIQHIARDTWADKPVDKELVALARLGLGSGWSIREESDRMLRWIRSVRRYRRFHQDRYIDREEMEAATTFTNRDIEPHSDMSVLGKAFMAINMLLGPDQDKLLYDRMLDVERSADADRAEPIELNRVMGSLLETKRDIGQGAATVSSKEDGADLLADSAALQALALYAMAGPDPGNRDIEVDEENRDDRPSRDFNRMDETWKQVVSTLPKLAHHVAAGVERGGRSIAAVMAAIALADAHAYLVRNTTMANKEGLPTTVIASLFDASPMYSGEGGQQKVSCTADQLLEGKTYDLEFSQFTEKAMIFEVNSPSPERQASAGVTVHYVPDDMPEEAEAGGINVERAIQLYDPQNMTVVTGNIKEVPLGAIVRVIVQVYVQNDTAGVVIEDLLPVGLEVLNPRLDEPKGSVRDSENYCPYYASGICDSWFTEYKEDRVIHHSPFVTAGSHSLTYVAVATTRGEFQLPPVSAWSVMDAATYGRSRGGKFTVAAPGSQIGDGEPLQTPVACPNHCSGNGVCNTAKGTCRCFPGQSEDDCSSVAKLTLSLYDNNMNGRLNTLRTYARRREREQTLMTWENVWDPDDLLGEVTYLRTEAKEFTKTLFVDYSLSTSSWIAFSASLSTSVGEITLLDDDFLGVKASSHGLDHGLTVKAEVNEQEVTIRLTKDDKTPSHAAQAIIRITGTTDGNSIAMAFVKLVIYPECLPDLKCEGAGKCKHNAKKSCDKNGKLGGKTGLDKLTNISNDMIIGMVAAFVLIAIATITAYMCRTVYRRSYVLAAQRGPLLNEDGQEADDPGPDGEMRELNC